MAESVNQQIADALVTQQLRAGRVETALRRDVLAQLALLEAELLAALKAGDPTAFALLTRRRREVETLMQEELDPLITTRYGHIAEVLDAALVRLGRHETQAVESLVNDVAPTEVIEEQPSERRLRGGIVLGLFPSAATPTDLSTTGAEWWQRQGASLSQRLGDQLQVSVSLEESLPQMVQRVRGTSEAALTDGLMGKARQDAQRLLTTQTTNAVSEARVAVAEANAETLIIIHQSVLDSRTSSICVARHGLRYTADTHEPIGHAIPYLSGAPYHPNCRSSLIPALPEGGPIRQETAHQWLARRDTAFQDEVLGPARARLFRAGKLTTRQLLDATSGRPLTLEEIGA
jgi:SPP1 gp7 family putative phage head morphogenesis protein